jgi:hypothetical protein
MHTTKQKQIETLCARASGVVSESDHPNDNAFCALIWAAFSAWREGKAHEQLLRMRLYEGREVEMVGKHLNAAQLN